MRAMSLSDHAEKFSFDIIAAEQRAARLPACVAAGLPDGLLVFAVDDAHSDTAQFSERYGFGLQDCANTLVLRYRKDGGEHYAAVVALGDRRLDVNGAVKARLGAQRLSFARREDATALTGMEFGGITAFGLPAGWPILVDEAVMQRPHVVMGAGVRTAKLLLAPAQLRALPGVDVAALSV
ncbi:MULTISPECIES: YbaK/EbsC family protein [Bordetella]|uniref:YbaK/aminoacyl-tRNA synthetase-associated domain-containing protein n=5 Tax=Bordetella TaxID=517 RepID=K0MG05_BORPB|nr:MULTISPECIES: YbaK/EbsC family protein [Bordetella]KAK68706.1 aminoacyl-tRNA editing domain protein [Bordetella bronchiseptica 980-2]SHR43130.1 YbaK/prolyl-tRNA synthetase associated domain-containing protein [Mycobacteroides abscessus subsp. abscessus]AMG87959.1 hypothetical protein AL472_09230 [Bordetella bronchiseptica]AWP74359.1 hypothetical protein B7P10_07760 [Bordetella bronchiseptica]AWP79179.1 hypothetical protein B7P04_07760 [Bordetella bronchiseptica]